MCWGRKGKRKGKWGRGRRQVLKEQERDAVSVMLQTLLPYSYGVVVVVAYGGPLPHCLTD